MHPLTISNQFSQLAAACPEIFESERRVFIISDENTHKLCWPVVAEIFPKNIRHIVTGAGELNKNLLACQVIWKHLFIDGADRNSIVLNLGGGTVTDIGGFAASTYMRGVRFINMPTSLLGIVDAGLGGKTGIDMDHYKNIIGTFTFPQQVLVYTGFLQTLPDTEWRNGIAEMLKHGLIRDQQLWASISDLLSGNDRLLTNDFKEKIISMIPSAVKVKQDIVSIDPKEKKERKFLNFGHTVGHALESWSLKHDHEPLTHGQAITAGMICETYISEKLQLLPPSKSEIIYAALRKLFPAYKIPKSVQPEIIKIMRHDKKSSAGDINMALLNDIGSAVLQERIPEELVLESLHFYNSPA